jgi:hypothetical protein
MFEIKHVNSRTTLASSSIRPSKEIIISISSLNFKLMGMANLNHHLTTNDLYIGLKYK